MDKRQKLLAEKKSAGFTALAPCLSDFSSSQPQVGQVFFLGQM